MSKEIVMNNPRLNHVLIELEMPIFTLNQVWANDRAAGKSDYDPTDSTVKTALRRVLGQLKGRPPKPLNLKKEKDEWIDNLTKNLWRTCQNLINQTVKKTDILVCIAAIEDSIKFHTVGDSRGYLFFLEGIFEELGATTQEIDEETAKKMMKNETFQ